MAYKFFGTPNSLVKERKRKYFENKLQLKPIFRFDGNGEFVTEDEMLIKKLKARFDCIEIKEEIENTVERKEHKCKKCEASFENKGLLLAHYRESHTKEG